MAASSHGIGWYEAKYVAVVKILAKQRPNPTSLLEISLLVQWFDKRRVPSLHIMCPVISSKTSSTGGGIWDQVPNHLCAAWATLARLDIFKRSSNWPAVIGNDTAIANKYNNWCKASKLIAPALTTIWSQIFKMGSWKKTAMQNCLLCY